jgi:outer membrane protein W
MNKYIAILILSLASLIVKAQGEILTIVNYLPAVSLGETADFANNISPRGVDFEVNKFIAADMSVGFVGSWNVFREKIVGESFEHEDMLVTGTQFRYVNIVPLNVNFKKYYLGSGSTPYIGVGLGTSYAKQENDIGVFTLGQEKWLFNVAPEIGLLYDISQSNILSLKVKYNYSPKAGDFPSVSYLSFGIGVGIK